MRSKLTTIILIGMVLGVLVGYFIPESKPLRFHLFGASFRFDATRLKPLSDAFIRLIRMMIAPIIFATVVTGIAGMGNVVDVSEASWDHVFAVNLKSAFLTMKHVIPLMARQGGGSIINISSIASIRHLGISYVTYATTKAAMNQMTRTTAVEYAPKNIRVNAVLPGLMKTPMVEHSAGLAASYAAGDVEAMWRARDAQVPMGHMGDAWDVANAALYLASDESRYVTGIELVVDGGITLKAG